jgi:hypothetical protein
MASSCSNGGMASSCSNGGVRDAQEDNLEQDKNVVAHLRELDDTQGERSLVWKQHHHETSRNNSIPTIGRMP